MSSSLEIVGDVRKLNVGPNDVLVVTVKHALSEHSMKLVRDAINSAFPDYKRKLLILPEDMSLTVVAKEEE